MVLCPRCKENEIDTNTEITLIWKGNETRFKGSLCIHCWDEIGSKLSSN